MTTNDCCRHPAKRAAKDGICECANLSQRSHGFDGKQLEERRRQLVSA